MIAPRDYARGAMKDHKSVIRIALGLLALCSVTLFAKDEEATKEEKQPSKAALEKYDLNKDGKLDEAETATMKAAIAAKAKATREANLAKYDANKDGKLDDGEKAARKADQDAEKAAARAEKEAKKAAKEQNKDK